jgi:hypothetical protein
LLDGVSLVVRRIDGRLAVLTDIFVFILSRPGDLLVKLNPSLLWKKLHLTRKELFLLAKWSKIEEETGKMLHLVYSFI